MLGVNMVNAKKQKFIKMVNEKGRILSDEEAFDFYIENIMKNEVTCKFNQWRAGPNDANVFEDYALWELESKAKQWHKITIGSLVLSGTLAIETPNPSINPT